MGVLYVKHTYINIIHKVCVIRKKYVVKVSYPWLQSIRDLIIR
jgi:hypothetical protein